MHIGFLTPEYVTPETPDGGLANYLRKIGFALAERGHQVSVFVLSDQDTVWQDGLIEVREIRRVTPPRWLFPTTKMHQLRGVISQYLSSRRLASKLWQVHRENPIDIIQASSYMAPGYVLLKNGRIPTVCRISSYTPLLRSAYGRQRSLNKYLSDWLEIRQVLDAEAAFAPSALMAKTFVRIEGYQPHVIHTPFDPREIETDPSYYQAHLGDLRYLLFFGTLSRIKGADLLADVLPSVLNRHKELSFVFIGRDDGLPGGQKVFDYILSHCQPFEDRLHYHPPLPKTQLFPIVANTLGVLMPSRVDNYPNACLEAQSFGVPVVGTYDSSLDEMIVDGETGFLADNGDPDSFYGAIERLLALTPSQRQEMQERILALVHSIEEEDRVGQLLSFYDNVIDNFESTD